MGTCNGKLRNVGSNNVNVGMVRIRFVLCGWKSVAVSLVFSKIIIDIRNSIHSIVMFIWLLIHMLIP